jgi:hypothetical protein
MAIVIAAHSGTERGFNPGCTLNGPYYWKNPGVLAGHVWGTGCKTATFAMLQLSGHCHSLPVGRVVIR